MSCNDRPDTDALGNSLICDRCDRHTGQGGTYGLGDANRRVCLDCLHDILDGIDDYENTDSDQNEH